MGQIIKEPNIWVTSDPHFCHNKDFIYAPRGFSTVEDMNEAIIQNWNAVVRPDDEVYLLGDVMLNNDVEGMKCLRRLNGIIHIVIGNHDTDARINRYINETTNVLSVEFAARLQFHGQQFYLTHYPTLCSNFDDGRPLRRKIINLCGHTHTSDRWADWDKGFIYHCELDAHKMTPKLLDEIYCECAEKYFKI